MKLRMDKSGRILLPKRLRERLHFHPGAMLEVEVNSEGLLLRQVETCSSLIRENGVLVHLGKLAHGVMWDRIVDDMREERIREAAGLCKTRRL